jgi:hypothetical protein
MLLSQAVGESGARARRATVSQAFRLPTKEEKEEETEPKAAEEEGGEAEAAEDGGKPA